MNPGGGPDPRRPVLVLIALAAVAAGYLGQGSVGIGARARPPAVAAIVTDVAGGPGTRQPVRLQVSLAVTNDGGDPIRVRGPGQTGPGTSILTATPTVLVVGPGGTGVLDLDVAVTCRHPQPPRLPDLDLELPDGARRNLRVGGSHRLLEGCGRAMSGVRPVSVEVVDGPSDGRLRLAFASPTGRRADISAIRADGVLLATTPARFSVEGARTVVVQVQPPAACPPQWQIAGIPSAITVDLAAPPPTPTVTAAVTPTAGPATTPATTPAVTPAVTPTAGPGAASPGGALAVPVDAVATVRLRLGPAITSWLLGSSCAEPA